MSGNVWELCQDWYVGDAYTKFEINGENTNPYMELKIGGKNSNQFTSKKTIKRIIRGRSWDYDRNSNRVFFRYYSYDVGIYNLGFRLVRSY